MRFLGWRRRAAGRPEPTAASSSPSPGDSARPLVGRYLTDGRSLYRVLHAIGDGARREPLLELEDCRTLELILCSRRALEDRQLRTVA